ncbi:MAG: polyphosphate kinase 1 [Acidiferrobacterales bacterium]
MTTTKAPVSLTAVRNEKPPTPAKIADKARDEPAVRKPAPENKQPAKKAKAREASTYDLTSPELYLNRELTWLEFNRRVLYEAQDERTPLLERIKFMAIVSSNLDEFFMKRIGGLKQQVGAGVQDLTVDGRTPQRQIEECCRVVRDIEAQKDALLPKLLKQLREHGIHVVTYDSLDEKDQEALRDSYVKNIFPLVTPQAVDPAHPFPFISNLSLNLLVTLRYRNDDEWLRARVKVPVGSGIPRYLQVGDSKRLVPLEQVMSHNLDLLFPKMRIEACELFHVTRNANTSRDEDRADDLLAMIESEVRDRKFAEIVRVVVQKTMDPDRRGLLAAELGLDKAADVFETDGMMAMRDLFELSALEESALHDTPHHPVDHAKLLDSRNIFHIVREAGAILLQHPYESFSTSVERFLKEASRDPKVRAIKMTLYRTSADTKVIDYLIDAARNGKQVAVAVELQARFDEAANIRWASRMEEAGIHVTYGVMGLKTHCKVILVVRNDYNGLRLYAHAGTGNYHAGTARLYTDLGLLTCDETLGGDLTELFNYLTTGYTPKRNYGKILPAPKGLKRSLLRKIQREIDVHSPESPGLIQFKLNALEDADITKALYRASRAGVHVDLIVRDTCRLRPGLPGLSDNVRVLSIVGRFLEHSRIYYFRNGGEEEFYIGSADAMKRNLEHRVEALVPVEDTGSRAELRKMLDTNLADRRSAWEMRANGTYVQRQPRDGDSKGSQEVLIQLADERLKGAQRLKRRKAQGISRRNIRR